ncbi:MULTISPECIES: hypothetical protein [Streptomyces]|uniref:Uncharacterized protein n=2 Tax=Streptomyces TaxID=1883 RepID=A0A100Y578_9ACTN|nr:MULTISPECIES: hypothetical protein [Streptomyces]KUH37924.1 hypothetical protein ATE80_15410 [Streptomyces kanasensis]UUS29753.1 hypothetical protein NRO40_02155 [Streptomyces changanensis]
MASATTSAVRVWTPARPRASMASWSSWRAWVRATFATTDVMRRSGRGLPDSRVGVRVGAPAVAAWPLRWSGCAGVSRSGCRPGAGSVRGLPSVAASWRGR